MTVLPEWTSLEMGDSQQDSWRFIGGPWNKDAESVITPSEQVADWNLAFWTGGAYRDFEAAFDFRWDIVWGDAALIVRAADAQHYYLVHFPVSGQQYRAEHFWAAVSKVDASGYVRILHMEMVPGVSSAAHWWHHADVSVQGNEICVKVDGRSLTPVRDATYDRAGLVGLASYSGIGAGSRSSFRNLQVRGRTDGAAAWNESIVPVRNWGITNPDGGSACTSLSRAGNGNLLTYSHLKQFRSKDNGQTWAPDDMDLGISDSNGYRPHLRADGRLERYFSGVTLPGTIVRSISDDNGHTWSSEEEVARPKSPGQHVDQCIYSSLLDTRQGSLLYFHFYRKAPSDEEVAGRRYKAGAVPGEGNYVLRSTDSGASWSAPIPLDNPKGAENHWQIPAEPSEISSAQTRHGGIIALVRPYASPVMWESWSHDDGLTWTPMARGAFAMYASTNSMLTTRSGVILIGGRFPGIAVQASFDDGMTWRCYQIDTALWANGSMYEIEPDVVLFVYGGLSDPHQLRYQVIRVTGGTLEPGPVVRGCQPGE